MPQRSTDHGPQYRAREHVREQDTERTRLGKGCTGPDEETDADTASKAYKGDVPALELTAGRVDR